MKTSSYKTMELCPILEQYFETKINSAKVKLISMIILVLCKVKNINYMVLANAFDNSASPESSMRRIQRFIGKSKFADETGFLMGFRHPISQTIGCLDVTELAKGKMQSAHMEL